MSSNANSDGSHASDNLERGPHIGAAIAAGIGAGAVVGALIAGLTRLKADDTAEQMHQLMDRVVRAAEGYRHGRKPRS